MMVQHLLGMTLVMLAPHGIEAYASGHHREQAQVSTEETQGFVQSSEYVSVTCVFVMILEDAHPGRESQADDGFEWVECEDDNGVTYYIEDTADIEHINPGDRVDFVLQATSPPNHTGIDITLPWEQSGDVFYKAITSDVQTSFIETSQSKVQTQTPKVMKNLMVILRYNDNTAESYVTEMTAMDGMYLTEAEWVTRCADKSLKHRNWMQCYRGGIYPGSMSEMIKRSSYGKLVAPRSAGKVVTVNMNKDWGSYPTCKLSIMASEGLQKVQEQFPEVDVSQYDFHEFYLPYSPGASGTPVCTFGGMAQMGVGHYSTLGGGKPAISWHRSPSPVTRAHELGHNLGLHHASGDNGVPGGAMIEYGDPEASMSGTYAFCSFIASARYQMGFIGDGPGEVLEWKLPGDTQPITIHSLSLPLNQPGADGVAIKFHCPACVSQIASKQHIVGGFVWVQFRGDEGYSALHLAANYQNKVYVHHARKYTNPKSGKGSELWATLGEHEHYHEQTGNTWVFVCRIHQDLATISIASSLSVAQEQCRITVPATPAAVTPAPATPVTPAPVTPAPATPAPATPAPATPAPASPVASGSSYARTQWWPGCGCTGVTYTTQYKSKASCEASQCGSLAQVDSEVRQGQAKVQRQQLGTAGHPRKTKVQSHRSHGVSGSSMMSQGSEREEHDQPLVESASPQDEL